MQKQIMYTKVWRKRREMRPRIRWLHFCLKSRGKGGHVLCMHNRQKELQQQYREINKKKIKANSLHFYFSLRNPVRFFFDGVCEGRRARHIPSGGFSPSLLLFVQFLKRSFTAQPISFSVTLCVCVVYTNPLLCVTIMTDACAHVWNRTSPVRITINRSSANTR